MPTPKRILVTPLNWGLGHATRCIPIIEALLARNFEVFLASDGRAYKLLAKEFINLKIVEIPGYNVTYKTSNMMFNMTTQLPKIISSIYKEHRAIEEFVEKNDIDLIISDNRYGCYSSKTKNIFITHQLNIKIPLRPFETMISYLNQKMIERFDLCWIPDFPGQDNLSGSLSRGVHNENVHYIGPLSRMKKIRVKQEYDAIVVLSGPEPQRTKFEEKILEQAKLLSEKILLVKGQTECNEQYSIGNIDVISYLTSRELNRYMMKSDVVISRSGYSTIMDLLYLGKKAILIPTPGQTEQVYLANRLHKKKIFYTQSQDKLDLFTALEEVENFSGLNSKDYPKRMLNKAMDDALGDIPTELFGAKKCVTPVDA